MKKLLLVLLLGATMAPLAGCVVVPDRPYAGAVWVPGHYNAGGFWIRGHYN
ncbi:MAG: hypothetical protein P4L54_03475 [Acidocella sp.]|jgi:hypothetical protein|nr:hypothetical protein [Acidocella sp.]